MDSAHRHVGRTAQSRAGDTCAATFDRRGLHCTRDAMARLSTLTSFSWSPNLC